MNKIRQYVDLDLRGSIIFGKPLATFPETPADNQMVLKDGVLWVWSDISGVTAWAPLTNAKSNYVHNQVSASTSWQVVHNLNSADFIYSAYSDAGVLLSASGITSIQANQFTLTFTEAITGKVVVFVESELFTPAVNSAAINTAALNVANGTVTADATGLYVNGVEVTGGGGGGGGAVTSVAGRTGVVVLSASDVSGLSSVATSGSYADLTNKPTLVTLGGIDSAEKGAVNGVATLDGGGKVPSAQLPSYVDDVIEVANFAALPGTGESSKIYFTLDNGNQYRWTGSAYSQITSSPGTTDAVPEGSTNLYFTTGRASSAAPVQSVAGRTGAVTLTASDIGSLATVATTGSYSDLSGKPSISGSNTGDQTITLTSEASGSGIGSFPVTLSNSAVINKVLTGYVKGAGTVSSADSILQAVQKLAGNFDTLSGGTVQSVSVTPANGVSGSVANATTTPAITLTLGAITPTSVASSGSVSGSNLSGTNTGDETTASIKTALGISTLSGSNTGDQTITLTGDVTGSGTGSFAATVTNAAVIGKVLTGYVKGAGTVAAADTLLQAIQKLDGNAISLAGANTWTKAQRGAVVALTPGATVTPDFSLSNNFSLTPAQNFTLAFPTNVVAGQSGLIVITQDATGSRVITFASGYVAAGGTKPVLSTSANAVDYISYYVETTGRVFVSITSAVF